MREVFRLTSHLLLLYFSGPGAALLFECHICDRKFKKQSDRDRHLYTHNVRIEQTVYKCIMCNHESSKRENLDAHYTKVCYKISLHKFKIWAVL